MAFRLTAEAECVASAPAGTSISSAYQDILLNRVVVAAVALHDGTVAVMDVSKSDPPTTSMELLIERNDLESLKRITKEFPHTIHVPFLDGKRTVIHRAAEKGSNDLMEVLLSAEIPFLLVTDYEGKTAVDIALARNFKTIVQLLVRKVCAPPYGIHPTNAFSLTKLLPKLIRKYPDVATELIQNLDFISAPALNSSTLAFSPAFPHNYIEFAKRERPFSLINSLGNFGIGSVAGSIITSAELGRGGDGSHGGSGVGGSSSGDGSGGVDSFVLSVVGKKLDELQPPLTGAIEGEDRIVRASSSYNNTTSIWQDLVNQHEETSKIANITSDRTAESSATASSGESGNSAAHKSREEHDVDDETLAKMHDDSLWQEVRVPVSLCVVPLPYILGFDSTAQERVLPPVRYDDVTVFAHKRQTNSVHEVVVGGGVEDNNNNNGNNNATASTPTRSTNKTSRLSRISSTFGGGNKVFFDPSNIDANYPQGFNKINKVALRETFLHAAVRSKHKDLFRTGILKAVMDYKWQAFGKRKFLWWLLWYTAFVILYTIVTALAVTRNVT